MIETKVFALEPSAPDHAAITLAATCLQEGGLVAFPTETVYGLGANALMPSAIEKIYWAKGRPSNNPLIVHLARLDQLEQVAVNIPPVTWALAEHFWPGPLTFVLPRHADVPAAVSAGRDTIAVRIPAHPVALALLEAAAVPVAAPSANRSTRPSATSAQHVIADLGGRVDVILDAGMASIGVESTVIDLTRETPLLLRPGGVSLEDLQALVPSLVRYVPDHDSDEATAEPVSPGMLYKHYAPKAKVLLYEGDDRAVLTRMRADAIALQATGQRVGLLLPEDAIATFDAADTVIESVGRRGDLDSLAFTLFAHLRALDAQNVDVILVQQVPNTGLGAAIADRLSRASEGNLIKV